MGCKWVDTIKINPDGTIERSKAQLVAKGYTQMYGVNYSEMFSLNFSEMFSSAAKLASVRLFISLAATFHWPLYQLDSILTLGSRRRSLHGANSRVCCSGGSPLVCVCGLKKSLHGLKQSHRAWFGRFSDSVTKFWSSKIWCCSFSFYIWLIVYVNDVVITGDDYSGIQQLILFL